MKNLQYRYVGIAIAGIALVIVFFLRFWAHYHTQNNQTVLVTWGNTTIRAIVADTQEKRSKGLSNTTQLKPYTGMWFLFSKEDKYGFWMKDMNYPIDIIWIDASLSVVHIVRNAQPDSYPAIFTPTKKALYVLEVPAGTAEALQEGMLLSVTPTL